MIQVTCACGATMQVQDENAGKQCKCPKCGAVCKIPAAAEAVAAPAAAAPPTAAPPAAAAPAAVPVAGARPGGLTALAVLNFVFGGFGIIGGLITLAAGSVVSSAGSLSDELADFGRRAAERSGDPNILEGMNRIAPEASSLSGMFYLLGILGLLLAAFLIVAGVGYLKQSKKIGYLFGNIYGIAAIIVVVLQIAMVSAGFGFMVILGLAYPIVTLALLNTVFKESFPNP
jgi:hypothetical protein